MARPLEALRAAGSGLYLAASAALAALAGLAVFLYLRSLAPTAEVWVVARDLPPGAAITAADLAVRRLPAAAVPPGAIGASQRPEGWRVRYGLVAGDVLREAHLVRQGSDVALRLGELPGASDAGFRAVAIPGDLVPVRHRLVPGDRLDLVGVVPVGASHAAVPIGTAAVLDVVAGTGPSDPSVVLVALRPDQVARFALALRLGSVLVAVQGDPVPATPIPPLRQEALVQAAARP